MFSYLTLRAILGALTALILSFVIGPRMIAKLSHHQVGQPVREQGPSSHLPKAGTPTMGGALILTAIVVSTLLWANLENRFIWIVLFVTLSFGVIGYVDDLGRNRCRRTFDAGTILDQTLDAAQGGGTLEHRTRSRGRDGRRFAMGMPDRQHAAESPSHLPTRNRMIGMAFK